MKKSIFIVLSLVFFVSSGFSSVSERKVFRAFNKAKKSVVYVKGNVVGKIKWYGRERDIDRTIDNIGVIINKKGYVLISSFTTNKNLSVKNIKVYIDKKEYDAKLIGTNKVFGISVLKINSGKERFDSIKFGNSSEIEGKWVIGIRSSGEKTSYRKFFSYSIITGSYEDGIKKVFLFNNQMNIIRQNFPVIDIAHNRLVGFGNTSSMYGIDEMKPFIKKIISSKGKRRKEGYLGIIFAALTKEQAEGRGIQYKGVIIRKVLENTPAKKAGLQDNDIITKVDNISISGGDKGLKKIKEVLKLYSSGEDIKIKVIRNNDKKILTATLTEKPKPEEYKNEWLGITVKAITDYLYYADNLATKDGVIISKVEQGSPASHAKMRKGDIITKINTSETIDIKNYKKQVEELEEKNPDAVLFKVERGNDKATIVVKTKIVKKKEE